MGLLIGLVMAIAGVYLGYWVGFRRATGIFQKRDEILEMEREERVSRGGIRMRTIAIRKPQRR